MLHIQDLALRRGPHRLIADTSLQTHPGHKVGVTGANGSGKSSLFAMILGELEPGAGLCRPPED